MNKHAPLATLVSVVLLGAVLLVVTSLNTPTTPAPAPAPVAAPAATPTTAAPVPAPAVTEKAYTGRSAGDEVTLAIAVKNGKAVAYVCDGRTVEAWLEGTLTGDTLALQGKTSTLTATVSDAETLGEVTVGGRALPFAARGVAAPAGLYEGRGALKGAATRVGWVVGGDGSVTGVANVGGTPQPAPTLDPRSPAVDGLTVTRVDGDATVVA